VIVNSNGNSQDADQELAARIRVSHRAAVEGASSVVRHALEAGRLLIEAKARAAHGTWAAWLRDSCELSERTAQRYMQLSTYCLQNCHAEADFENLSLRAINKLIVEPRSTFITRPPISLSNAQVQRCGKLLRMALSTDSEAEIIASVRALRQSLLDNGFDLHVLAAVVERALSRRAPDSHRAR
jgi:hypothetical protein